ncbi:unnamed protein product [Gongylonema pulchrum]|uniref:Uncharacterized protein n=1 Tax=Gongylonema pulchrum TaxID=637853 RepID=A0A183DX37_9BILA|nr:unnamed protein product [Gongylonema pulchrum]
MINSTREMNEMALREAAIKHGVLDILLNCLAHYSHHKHKEDPIRPPFLMPAPETAILIDRLLQSTSEMVPEEGAGRAILIDRLLQSTSEMVLSTFIYPGVEEFLHTKKNGAAVSGKYHGVAPLAELEVEDAEMQSQAQSPVGDAECTDAAMAELSQEPVPAPADLCQWSLSTAVIAMLSRSCLLPAIWAYLRNDSVLDISQHVEVYEAVVQIVAALALSAQSASGEEEIEIRALLSDPTSDCSVLSMLKKLFECVSAYLTRITVESNEARLQK